MKILNQNIYLVLSFYYLTTVSFCSDDVYSLERKRFKSSPDTIIKDVVTDINGSPIRKIDNALKQSDLKSPEVTVLITNLQRLQKTPNKSAEIVSRQTANHVLQETIVAAALHSCDLTDDSSGEDVVSRFGIDTSLSMIGLFSKESLSSADSLRSMSSTRSYNLEVNKSLHELFLSPNKDNQRKRKVVEVASTLLPQTERLKKLVAVNTPHIASPQFELKKDGTLKNVKGGHNLDTYNVDQISPLCFIGQDGKTLGISVNNIIPKTVQAGLDERTVLMKVKNSQKVAFLNENKHIHKTTEGEYMGVYYDPQCSLVSGTSFPILSVCYSQSLLNSAKEIRVGSMGMIARDRAITKKSEVFLPISEFKKILNDGKLLSIEDGMGQVTDISEPMFNFLKPVFDDHELIVKKGFGIFAFCQTSASDKE